MKRFFLASLLLTTLLFISCEDNEQFVPPKVEEEKAISNLIPEQEQAKQKVLTSAISFVNNIFLSQERDPLTRGSSEKYTEDDIAYIREIAYIDGSPLLKIICLKKNGYILLNDTNFSDHSNVLYYSDEKFDENNLNPGFIDYIEEFATKYEYEKAIQNKINEPITRGNDEPPYGYKDFLISSNFIITQQTPPLLTTSWSQYKPYNKSCPMIGNNRAAVGCVAIAVGQIMNYHKKNTKKTYNWEKINGDRDKTNDLADFLYDIGRGVGMDYGFPSSGAKSSNADLYLKTSGYLTYRNAFDFNKVKRQIVNKKRPVYLFGKSKKRNRFLGIIHSYEGGHAWVADGYKKIISADSIRRMYFEYGDLFEVDTIVEKREIEFLHMNWGWGNKEQANEGAKSWVTYDYTNGYNLDDYEGKGHKFKYKKGMIICY